MFTPEVSSGGEFNYDDAESCALLLGEGFDKLEGFVRRAKYESAAQRDATWADLATYAPTEQTALDAATKIKDVLVRLPVRGFIAHTWEDADLQTTVRREVAPLLGQRTNNGKKRAFIWNLGLQVAIQMRDPQCLDLVANEGDRERMWWNYAEQAGDIAVIREIGGRHGKHFPHYKQMLSNIITHSDEDVAPYLLEYPLDTEQDKLDLDEILFERAKEKKSFALVADITDSSLRMRALVWLASKDGGAQPAPDGLYKSYATYWGDGPRNGGLDNYVFMLNHYMERTGDKLPLADLRTVADELEEEADTVVEHRKARIEVLSILAREGDTDAAVKLIEAMNIDSVPADERWRWHKHLANLSIGLGDPRWARMIRGNGGEGSRNNAIQQIAIRTLSPGVLKEEFGTKEASVCDDLLKEYCSATCDTRALDMITDPIVRIQTAIEIAVQSGLNVIADDIDSDSAWKALSRLCARDSEVLADVEKIAELTEFPEMQFRLYENHYRRGGLGVLSDMVSCIERSPDADKFRLMADMSVHLQSREWAYEAIRSFIVLGQSTLRGLDATEQQRVVNDGIILFRNVKQLILAA